MTPANTDFSSTLTICSRGNAEEVDESRPGRFCRWLAAWAMHGHGPWQFCTSSRINWHYKMQPHLINGTTRCNLIQGVLLRFKIMLKVSTIMVSSNKY
eukprot:3043215-Pleurochrysis_carterae.AAC.1